MSVAPPGIASYTPGASVDMRGTRGRVRAAEHRLLELEAAHLAPSLMLMLCWIASLQNIVLLNLVDALAVLQRLVMGRLGRQLARRSSNQRLQLGERRLVHPDALAQRAREVQMLGE